MAGTLEDPIIEDLTHMVVNPKPGYRVGKTYVIRVSKSGVVKKVIYNRQYKIPIDKILVDKKDIRTQLRDCDDLEVLEKIKSLIEESKNKGVNE